MTKYYIAYEVWRWDGRGIDQISERNWKVTDVHPFEWLLSANGDGSGKHYIILWCKELTAEDLQIFGNADKKLLEGHWS